jgi:hypothetical protein
LAIIIFQSPFNGGCVLDGDRKNSTSIRKIAIIQFSITKKKGGGVGVVVICFWKAIVEGFLKTYVTPTSMAIKNFQSPQRRVTTNFWSLQG